jgi:hypothetical protein
VQKLHTNEYQDSQIVNRLYWTHAIQNTAQKEKSNLADLITQTSRAYFTGHRVIA